MKWIKIGLVLSLLIFAIFGIAWKSGCPTGDRGLKEGAIVDSLMGVNFFIEAQGKYAPVEGKSGADYRVYKYLSSNTHFHILGLTWTLIYNSYDIDSITYEYRTANTSDADSLCIIFGLARRKIGEADCYEYEAYEYDDTVYFFSDTCGGEYTTIIDSSNARRDILPLMDCIKADGSALIIFLDAYIYSTVE